MFSNLIPFAACLLLCQAIESQETIFGVPFHQETASTPQPFLGAETMATNAGTDAGSIHHDEMDHSYFNEPCVADGEDWGDGNPVLDQRWKPGSMMIVGLSSSGTERITGGNRWTKVHYQPLEFSVSLPQGTNAEAVRFWLNGLPADPEMLSLQSDWSSIDARNVTATYQWPCPPLGKIVLQVEYLMDDVWSKLSRPLRIEVMPPSIPQPVAAGASVPGLIPISIPAPSIECLNHIVVKFANVAPGASVVADVEGYGHVLGSDELNCCYSFDLKSLLPVGRHKMTFRQVDSKHCGLSSHASSLISINLSFDPNVEVAIDNIKGSRRLAMLNDSEHLIRTTHTQEVDWMRQQLRNPCPKLWPPTGMSTSEPAPIVELSEGLAQRQEDTDCLSSAPYDELTKQKNTWDKRSQQASVLSNYLESLESAQDSMMGSFKTDKFVTKIDFDTPTVFKSSRKVYPIDGAVAGDLTILEGMRISAAANGTYRIEFKYIAPQTPAVVHLQIQFLSEETSGWKTLTLAPITVKPINYSEPETLVHHVVQEGYSAALERVGGYIIQVRRRGSSVSGYNLNGASESLQF